MPRSRLRHARPMHQDWLLFRCAEDPDDVCGGTASSPSASTTTDDSEGSVRHDKRLGARPLVTLLVLSIVSVSVRAFAGQSAARDIPSPSQPLATTLPITLRSVNSTPLLQPRAIQRSIAIEARRLAASAEAQTNGNTNSVHQRNWAGRHPVLVGTVIGFGFGVGDQAIQCVSDPGTRFFPCNPGGAAAVGGILAGIGAGVGAVVGIFLR
jgi:hypothetical protein